MSASDLFTIVTPTLNSEDFLDETIALVVTQAGDFSIRYHIQDGGSKDGTLAIVEAWQARLTSGALPSVAAASPSPSPSPRTEACIRRSTAPLPQEGGAPRFRR